MISSESLKGKVKQVAKSKNLSSQEVLQMFFFERFLERLSNSKYKCNFVIKGGLLVASMIGIGNRTTMDMDTTVKLFAYPLETILAEKYESIIKRNISTTRMRDFYDLYILYQTRKDEINFEILKQAILSTAQKRDSITYMKEAKEIVEDIEEERYLHNLWSVYLNDNPYIGNLSFLDTIKVIRTIAEKVEIL